MSLCRPYFHLLRRFAAATAIQSTERFRIPQTRYIKRWVSPTLKELYKRRTEIGPEPEKPRSTYLEWNYEAELFAFGKRLGEEFDKKILRQALTQREYANLQEFQAKERGETLTEHVHNYELIKEGETILSDYLKAEFDKLYPQEVADAVYNYLMSEEMLSHIGSHIGLKDIILTNEFPVENRTLSNTFKAVVSALSRSVDLTRAQIFIKDFVVSQMYGKDAYEIWDPKEPYEFLTRILKEQGISELEPRLCNQSGINTILACFQVGIYSNKKLLGIGWGESIEIAKQTAARDAICNLNRERHNKAFLEAKCF